MSILGAQICCDIKDCHVLAESRYSALFSLNCTLSEETILKDLHYLRHVLRGDQRNGTVNNVVILPLEQHQQVQLEQSWKKSVVQLKSRPIRGSEGCRPVIIETAH